MTRDEFAQVTAYIAVACGKDLSPEAHEVYFDLLGDLPFEAGQLAARRVMLEHKWSTFPSIAELRQAAAESMRGTVAELFGAEAWALAWKAVARIDLEVDGSKERAFKSLPPIVAESLNAMGLASVIGGDEPVGVIRGQFIKVYEQLAARERRKALLPAAIQDDIKKHAPGIADARPIVGRLANSFGIPE